MQYTALYRQYRPKTFDEVVGQHHIVSILKNSVKSDRVGHAYLFCGTRGTGKTSMAHILARAVNCEAPSDGNPCNECETCKGILSGMILDVLEIDAASNNSVDNIREIREEVVYSPSQAKFKVYIIDEVHMLSSGAFNALLKTLEEPPSHVIFILATTEPHKLPATILSRCQRYDFHRIPAQEIIGRLEFVAQSCGAAIEDKALRLIAAKSDGALRDALSILDQCLALGKQTVTYEDVLATVGIVDYAFLGALVAAHSGRDTADVLEYVDRLIMDGKDVQNFVSDLILYYRNLLLFKVAKNPSAILGVPDEAVEAMKKIAGKFDKGELIYAIRELSSLEPAMRWAAQPRIILEAGLVKLCEGIPDKDILSIEERLSLLESRVASQPAALASQSVLKNSDASSNADSTGVSDSKTTPDNGSESDFGNNQPAANEEIKPSGLAQKAKSKNESNASPIPEDNSLVDSEKPDETAKATDNKSEHWNKILALLDKRGKKVLHMTLLSAKVAQTNDKLIDLEFEYEAHKNIAARAENLKTLEGTCSEVFGYPVAVRVSMASERGSGSKTCSSSSEKLVSAVEELAEKLGTRFDIIDE